MHYFWLAIFFFFSVCVNAQMRSFLVHEGDTINIIDKDSLKQGVWRTFHSGDKLKSETVYKNNKKQGLDISWYSSGCVKQETFYNNGQLDGPTTFYSHNCKKELTEYFKNGVKDGLEISYFANGRIKSEGNFKKGNLDGV